MSDAGLKKNKTKQNLAPVDDSLDGCDVGFLDKNVLNILFNFNSSRLHLMNLDDFFVRRVDLF